MPYDLNSQEYFEQKLSPLLRTKYPSTKVRYEQVIVDGYLAGHEYVVKVKTYGHLGLEPYATRRSCNDDPAQLAEFLKIVANGALHPSCWRNLLGPYTQYLIMSGKRPGFPAMIKKDRFASEEARTPTEILEAAFNQAKAEDDDIKRVARKKDYDESFVKKVLGEKKHLLEGGL